MCYLYMSNIISKLKTTFVSMVVLTWSSMLVPSSKLCGTIKKKRSCVTFTYVTLFQNLKVIHALVFVKPCQKRLFDFKLTLKLASVAVKFLTFTYRHIVITSMHSFISNLVKKPFLDSKVTLKCTLVPVLHLTFI